MPNFHTQKQVRHSAQKMFALVADIEHYPQFVPMCEALTIRTRQEKEDNVLLVADMTVGYKLIRESFTTQVYLQPALQRIDVHYVDGPFKYLENRWQFLPLAEPAPAAGQRAGEEARPAAGAPVSEAVAVDNVEGKKRAQQQEESSFVSAAMPEAMTAEIAAGKKTQQEGTPALAAAARPEETPSPGAIILPETPTAKAGKAKPGVTGREAVEAESCLVDFYIDYAFKNPLLAALMGTMFDIAFRRFTQAFEKRADEIYGRL